MEAALPFSSGPSRPLKPLPHPPTPSHNSSTSSATATSGAAAPQGSVPRPPGIRAPDVHHYRQLTGLGVGKGLGSSPAHSQVLHPIAGRHAGLARTGIDDHLALAIKGGHLLQRHAAAAAGLPDEQLQVLEKSLTWVSSRLLVSGLRVTSPPRWRACSARARTATHWPPWARWHRGPPPRSWCGGRSRPRGGWRAASHVEICFAQDEDRPVDRPGEGEIDRLGGAAVALTAAKQGGATMDLFLLVLASTSMAWLLMGCFRE